jgi:hypothetical protein
MAEINALALTFFRMFFIEASPVEYRYFQYTRFSPFVKKKVKECGFAGMV